MSTKHIFLNKDSSETGIDDETINLIVTSPPYPMIEMWDHLYLENDNYNDLFEKTHKILDKIWEEMFRILIPGGIACINIGDATKRIGTNFKLFSNSSRIINKMESLGFNLLPSIVWAKPSNSPNKFMGSGTLPVNAYISLGHEHILVFRKGTIRKFSPSEQIIRRESAFFWRERNVWFSDIWNIKGIRQSIQIKSRKKSAAFPMEISDRLINMFSIKGDWVIDPFAGTGTTSASAIKLERNSYYFDIDNELFEDAINSLLKLKIKINNSIEKRIEDNSLNKKEGKYFNSNLNYWVKSKQEEKIKINKVEKISKNKNILKVEYS